MANLTVKDHKNENLVNYTRENTLKDIRNNEFKENVTASLCYKLQRQASYLIEWRARVFLQGFGCYIV